jgi:hypothetical protein
MEVRYQILLLIDELANTDPQPLSYQCRPRELILRQMQDWSAIWEQVRMLEAEELVISRQLETMVISLTEKGMDKAIALRSSLHSFSS